MNKNQSSEREIQHLIDIKIDKLKDIDFLEEEFTPQIKMPQGIPRELKTGKSGLEQLLKSPKIQRLEDNVSLSKQSDTPKGQPLAASVLQITQAERSSADKSKVQKIYQESLKRTAALFCRLASGEEDSYHAIQDLVGGFLNTLSKDRALLLNLSHQDSNSGDYLYYHAVNVCLLALNIATASGFSKEQVLEIGQAALLSDIGMMLVPESIRLKKERLTRDESYEVQKHPILGFHLLNRLNNLPERITYGAYQHHERESGAGYPKGRKGHLIHNYAKVISVADVYEALSSKRSYRKAYNPYTAMKSVLQLTRVGILSKKDVKSFLSYMSLFPVGSLVKLSTGHIGKVTQANERLFARPLLSVLTDTTGALLAYGDIFQIDLAQDEDINVAEAMSMEDLSLELMHGF